MNKKIIVITCLSLLSANIQPSSFGGGFATGAILGTGVTLAATSGSRNANRDPYYEVDRERARQEAREIREENRLKREDDARRRKAERRQAEEERQLERDLKHKRNQLYSKHQLQQKNNNRQSNSQLIAINPAKKPSENRSKIVSDKELEIKKLTLELKQLELEKLQAAA